MARHLRVVIGLGVLVGLVVLLSADPLSADRNRSQSSRKRFGSWTQLFDGKTYKGTFAPEVSFVGVGPILKDPFHIHDYQPDGDWSIVNRQLVPVGKNSLLGLGEADEFELEAVLSAEGLGGWLVVFGWQPEEKSGAVAYNVTLVKSGSPWHLDFVHDGHVTLEEHREVARFEWKGVQRLQMAVIEKKIYLAVGDRVLYDGLDVPDYEQGLVALGTYDTRYGPKPLRIASLRIRTR